MPHISFIIYLLCYRCNQFVFVFRRSALWIKNGSIPIRKVSNARSSVEFCICTSTLNDTGTGDKLIGLWPEKTQPAVIKPWLVIKPCLYDSLDFGNQTWIFLKFNFYDGKNSIWVFSLKLIIKQSRVKYQFVSLTSSKSLDLIMITNKMWSIEQDLELVKTFWWISLCWNVGVYMNECYVLKLWLGWDLNIKMLIKRFCW